MIKNDITLENILLELYQVPDSKFDGRFTKTTQFLLPAISIDINNKVFFKYFENAFLDDQEYEHTIERAIFLQFAVKDIRDLTWIKYCYSLMSKDEFILDYDIGQLDGHTLIMMVFQVPEKYTNEYYRFREGRYSFFSEEYKKKFSRFVIKEGNKFESVVWGAMHRSPDLQSSVEERFGLNPGYLNDATDIWERPRTFRETYRYNKEKKFHTLRENYLKNNP